MTCVVLKSYYINIVVNLTRVRCAVGMPRERDITQARDAKRAMTQLLQVAYTASEKVVSECVATATLFENLSGQSLWTGLQKRAKVFPSGSLCTCSAGLVYPVVTFASETGFLSLSTPKDMKTSKCGHGRIASGCKPLLVILPVCTG